jgi:outer membrane lipoprotein SlyB
MMIRTLVMICASALILTACGKPLQTNIVPIKNPMGYASALEKDGLQIGFDTLSPSDQVEQFNVDMTNADVVPIRVVVRNDSQDEFYIKAEQIFGRTSNADLYPAYRLDQTIERIRQSEVGKAMASGAVAGVLVGAAIGAAAGAAIGGAVDGSSGAGQGAALGAATGGTAGGISGAVGYADAVSRQIAVELRKVDWGNRVVYPGHIEHGFLFMKPGVAYEAIEVLIYNVNQRKNERIAVSLR